ncbi:MAG: diadenylate cyclase CdaA [Clostridium sp.]|nr:diadenylate cyclase CdaA [Clostridium sp.]
MERFTAFADKYLSAVHIPNYMKVTDVVEILIISFLVYQIMVWIKNTRAWAFLKGVLVILAFIGVAAFFHMSTILWIAENVISVAAIAVVIIMQPELRKALEQLGSKNFLNSVLPFEATRKDGGRYTDRTVNEIVRACFEMGRVRTGALIVMEQTNPLSEYERTGITVDGLVTSQLLINIFEHNTPLHDGAVIVRGERVTSATCYLPLSDNRDLSKELGTRHRAAVGISEATDSLTLVVSEETGYVSVAYKGELYRDLDADGVKEKIAMIQDKPGIDEKKHRVRKGRSKA